MLHKADSVVDILIALIERSSNNIYTGYRLKALIQHAVNPEDIESGLAKPYYEKVIEIITSQENIESSAKQILLEAYKYLGYYYYVIKDKPNTILYWNKILVERFFDDLSDAGRHVDREVVKPPWDVRDRNAFRILKIEPSSPPELP